MKRYEKLTFGNLLKTTVEEHGKRPAMGWVGEKSITYNELSEKVDIVVKLLFKKGIRKGDRVVILSENQPNWGVAFFAITKIGAIAVPVMQDLSIEQIDQVITHSGAQIFFVSNKQSKKIEKRKDNVERILIDDFSVAPSSQDRKNLEDSDQALNNIKIEEDDTAIIIYTSGTMGRIKGVILSHKNIISNAIASIKCASLTKDYRSISILPMSHMIELTLGLVAPIIGGASIYYLREKVDERSLLKACKIVRPTLIVAVPLLLERIYKNKVKPLVFENVIFSKLYSNNVPGEVCKKYFLGKPLSYLLRKKLLKVFGGKLKLFSMGGSALDLEAEKFFRSIKFPYALGYGLTEASPLITGPICLERYLETPLGSSGRVLTGGEIKIINPDSETGIGEILARGSNITKGYYREEELTKELFSDDAWLKTGDLGLIDDNGFLFVKGRLKNVIIRSDGRNIYPEEIEEIISRQKYIDKVLVFEKEGQIIAEVNLDLGQIKKDQKENKIVEILENIREQTNKVLPIFSRVNKIINQAKPFELTPTKKVRRVLNEKEPQIQVIEERVKKICNKVLKGKKIDLDFSFYDLGIDSLDVVELHSELEKEFPGKIALTDMFANPSIKELVKFLVDEKKQ